MAKKPASKNSKKKQQNGFQKLVSKATGTRRAMFVTGLIGVLMFSSIGYYVINHSSAAITPASVCGSGYVSAGSVRVESPYGSGNYGPAKAHILVNKGAKKACAVLMSTGSAYGVRKSMSTTIRITNNSGTLRQGGSDSGSYRYYAGPVYVSYRGYNSSSIRILTVGKMNYGGKSYETRLATQTNYWY